MKITEITEIIVSFAVVLLVVERVWFSWQWRKMLISKDTESECCGCEKSEYTSLTHTTSYYEEESK